MTCCSARRSVAMSSTADITEAGGLGDKALAAASICCARATAPVASRTGRDVLGTNDLAMARTVNGSRAWINSLSQVSIFFSVFTRWATRPGGARLPTCGRRPGEDGHEVVPAGGEAASNDSRPANGGQGTREERVATGDQGVGDRRGTSRDRRSVGGGAARIASRVAARWWGSREHAHGRGLSIETAPAHHELFRYRNC